LRFDTTAHEEPDFGPEPDIILGELLGQRLMGNEIHLELTSRSKGKAWPPAPEVGMGGDGHGWVTHIEVIFRAVCGVEEPAPSLA
jgi:hypothetical protein